MKKFLRYFVDFHRDYFHVGMYLACGIWIAALIVFNYSIDFEDGWIDRKFTGTGWRPLWFFLTHAVAYYGTLLIIWLFRRKRVKFSRLFWIKSLLVFSVIGFDRSLFIYHELKAVVPRATLQFWFQTLSNLTSAVTVLLPAIALKFMFDRRSGDGLYGISFRKTDFRPYWMMMAFMIPVLFLASYIPEIRDYYPIYRRVGGASFAQYYHVGEWVPKTIFELCYVSDFIFTELFFRGLLVVGFARLLGKDTVIPMAATYATLHFGKPIGETVSSIFGGYILGILALYSRNIWGGIFVHGGVAFFMEVFAFLRMAGTHRNALS